MEVKFWYGKEAGRKNGSVISVSIKSNMLIIKMLLDYGSSLRNGVKFFPVGSPGTVPATSGN